MPILQMTPPKANEIEVSIFGPGFGESIVAHVGEGKWIIIDSCVDELRSTPTPIKYLELIGQNPAECVCIIVATHWHDDHIAGLSDTLEACEKALFCCPNALSKKEFLQLAELYQEAPGSFPEGTSEIQRALEISAHRSRTTQTNMLKFATEDKLIFSSPTVRLVALSPSDEMNRRALEFMATAYALALSGDTSAGRLVAVRPNDVATVLRLDVAERSVLLGSDLEAENNPLTGWTAVFNSLMASERTSSIYKVAHHGSKSGWHDEIWSRMLETRPLALMSPFRWGAHKLPNAIDRARILSMTNRAFITADPNRVRQPTKKRAPKIEAFISQTTKTRRIACGPVGHIRWRADIRDLTDEGDVELFDGALSVADVA